MKKKKILTMVAAVALVAVIGVGATLAYFTDKDSKTNVVTMGKVDIKLEEPVFSENYDGNTITDVKPNQSIVKDPKITVEDGSLDAYVRAKIVFEGLNQDQIDDILPLIDIDTEKWFLSTDGYYYYQAPMTAGASDYLFQSVKIPEKWGNEVSGLTFKINVFAEAIQADSFTPYSERGLIMGWRDSDGNDIQAETSKTETTEQQ